MSAALKTVAVLSGLTLTGAATMHSINHKSADFSAPAFHASGIDMLSADKPKAKLPSEYFSFTVRDFKLSNAA